MCGYCDACLLKGEYQRIEDGMKSPCCGNGEVHTDDMITDYAELQDPPAELVELIDSNEKEQFLNNTMSFNSNLAFASVRSTREENLAELCNRPDTMKYNGIILR